MAITYRDTKIFDKDKLRDLFLSVDWESGRYPEKLVAAIRGYDSVYSAWDGDKPVGMICAMDDGVMTAYVHYLLVDPEYQKQNIGRTLVDMIKKKYADYLRIVLVAYGSGLKFYENCGFARSNDGYAMYIDRM